MSPPALAFVGADSFIAEEVAFVLHRLFTLALLAWPAAAASESFVLDHPAYRAVQQRLAHGWSTWHNRRVATHVSHPGISLSLSPSSRWWSLFTMDIYKGLLRPGADDRRLLGVGRLATGVLVVAGCLMAPLPGRFEGVFRYIQLVWGFISPGVVAAFFFGLVVRRAPQSAAVAALALGVPIYGLLLWRLPETAFLNHMAITFVALIAVMTVITWLRPLPAPAVLEASGDVDLAPSPLARWVGIAVLVATIALYAVFW